MGLLHLVFPSNNRKNVELLQITLLFIYYLQALLFYIPRYLWKTWEGGKIKMLVQGMNVPIIDSDKKEESIEALVKYFTVNKRNHELYALK